MNNMKTDECVLQLRCHSFFYIITFLILCARLTIKSKRKRSDTPIVEYPVAIVESIKHPTAIRKHRLHRLRTKGWIHGWRTHRTRVRRMTEEFCRWQEEGRACSLCCCVLGAISRTNVLQLQTQPYMASSVTPASVRERVTHFSFS